MIPLLFLALSSSLLPAQAPVAGRPAWPVGLSASARPAHLSHDRATVPAKAPSPPAPPPTPNGTGTPAKVPESPARRGARITYAGPPPGFASDFVEHAPWAVGTDEWLAALHSLEDGLAHPGRALATVTKMETDFDERPQARASIGYRLADLYVALGWWQDAYRLMAPLATQDADRPTLLRASVAAAWKGEVYPGQRAFCVRSIQWGWSDMEDRRENMPQGETPADVLTVSLLATMLDADGHNEKDAVRLYGGMVLQRDPGNPIVCDVLARYALAEGHTADAIALLNKGLPRARGPMADALRSDLRSDRRITPAQMAAAMARQAKRAAKSP